MWMCETKVAMLFLMLASDTTIAMCGNIEDEIVKSESMLNCFSLYWLN